MLFKSKLNDWSVRGGKIRGTREIARYAGVQPQTLPIGLFSWLSCFRVTTEGTLDGSELQY
jgi:hypothetical protein